MKYFIVLIFVFISVVGFTQQDSLKFLRDSMFLSKQHFIFFEFDKATIREESFPVLDSIALYLSENSYLKIEIQNHSDGRGSEKYSRRLTVSRARSVRDYLINKGVSEERLKAQGYEGTKPIIAMSEILKMKSKEEQEVAHQRNRRTEFVVIGE